MKHIIAKWRGRRMFGALLRVEGALLAVGMALVIGACGGGEGGVGSGGTGSEPSQSSGTVTGFGSIFIDGVRFDDSDAAVRLENAPGSMVLAEAKLGQQVEAEFQIDRVAQVIRIEPELIGRVTDTSVGMLKVLGQTVVANTDPTMGPVTQYADGYADLADVQVGDAVEVHGIPRLAGNGYVVQATRIEKLAALPAYLRVTGVVTQLDATEFKLGELTVEHHSAVLRPVGGMLHEGQRVVVLAAADQLSVGPRLVAAQVRIKQRVNGDLAAYLGGVVAELDTATSHFNLCGVLVDFSGATITPSLGLMPGMYVQVRGTFQADGSMKASSIDIRNRDDRPQAELKGSISGFSTSGFLVRDVMVATGSSVQLRNCPASGLADGLYVEIQGAMGPTGVVAQTVTCGGEPPGAIIERIGVAGSVDVIAKTFTLATGPAGRITVRWSSKTFFRDVMPQTLDGQPVRVEGMLMGDVLLATKVRADR